MKNWIADFFEWLVYSVKFFERSSYEFIPTDITRGLITVFRYQLSFTDGLFCNGFRVGIEPLPWITVFGIVAILGHWVAGWQLVAFLGGSFLYLSLYKIGSAALVCIIVGFPIGLYAARNDRLSRGIILLCDFMQTFPSFIYLIPAIMMGVNQVIFMALFMVAITALIGTRDLGTEINRARTGNKRGRALVAGFCIAFLGMIADRLIKAWLKRREEARSASIGAA